MSSSQPISFLTFTVLILSPIPPRGSEQVAVEGLADGWVFAFRLPPATKAPRGPPSPHQGAEENGKKQAENRWVGIRAV